MADDATDGSPQATKLWWAVPAVGVILLALLSLVTGTGPESVDYGTSYDASGRGFRGAYLILNELKVPSERSRRPAFGTGVRWVLFPVSDDAKEARLLGEFARGGGRVLLGVDEPTFAAALGFSVTVQGGSAKREKITPFGSNLPPPFAPGESMPAEAPDVNELSVGQLKVRASSAGRTWGTVDGGPLLSIHSLGRGEVWLLHRPDVLCNVNLQHADNAVLLVRLAEEMLRDRPNARIEFDEYCHGLRDRPNVFELLFRMPALPVTIQAALVMALVLWRSLVRFGTLQPLPDRARRSKEEFLTAMGDLLARKGDRADAYRTVRDDYLLRLQTDLGLPATATAEQTLTEAARRRGIDAAKLLPLFTADGPPGGRRTDAFLTALTQLEAAFHECSRSPAPAR